MLGVDPGLTRCGLGVVDGSPGRAALVAVGVVWWLLSRSSLGYRIRAVGENPPAARAAGIEVGRTYTTVMVISGALMGLAATNQTLGTVPDGVTLGLDAGIGFDAITVALLGRSRPLGILGAGSAGGDDR